MNLLALHRKAIQQIFCYEPNATKLPLIFVTETWPQSIRTLKARSAETFDKITAT